MKIGTKSILFGAHQFILHPLLVAIAWWRLYGFPSDPRLWIAFLLHDLGYWGKPNMDGPEGDTHPEWAARLMYRWFDPPHGDLCSSIGRPWYDLCLYHSRYRARRDGQLVSRLGVADKFVIAMEPGWFYLPRVWLTGELAEYMERAKIRSARNEHLNTYEHMAVNSENARIWHRGVKAYIGRWVEEHRDGRPDTWTPGTRSSGKAE